MELLEIFFSLMQTIWVWILALQKVSTGPYLVNLLNYRITGRGFVSQQNALNMQQPGRKFF